MTRASFDAFLQGQPGAAVLLPAVEQLASRVGSDSYETMTADPALWGGYLARVARLLDIDGVMIGFDHAAGLVATTADPLLQNAMEAVDRLGQTDGSWLGCIGVMTGPVTLAHDLGEEAAKQAAIEIAESYCKKRPDLLLLREGAALGQADIGMPQRKAYNTIRNMAAYYSVPLAIYLEDYDPDRLDDLVKLKIDHVLLGADSAGQAPAIDAIMPLIDGISAIGLPLPFADATRALDLAATYRTACAHVALAFTSLGPIEKDADLTTVRSLTGSLRTLG